MLFVFQGCGLRDWEKEEQNTPVLLSSASLLGEGDSTVTADLELQLDQELHVSCRDP